MAAQRSRGGRRVSRAPSVLPGLVLVALLLGLVAWSVAALQPPAPKAADAPADEFSADPGVRPRRADRRADPRRRQRRGRRRGHATSSPPSPGSGSTPGCRTPSAPGSRRRLDATWPACTTWSASCRAATRPGGSYLMAHHDSVAERPGRIDDGAGVVDAAGDGARTDRRRPSCATTSSSSSPTPRRPASAGPRRSSSPHPLGRSGGVALNFEARGTSGPADHVRDLARQRRPGRRVRRAAPHPVATSFAVEVYRALPNDTDFSVLLADGRFTGLNTAYIDGAAAYHTPQDRPERMDRASLQAMGDNALALVRELGNRDLGPLREAGRRGRHLLPGARPAGPLPRQPGLAARRRGAARRRRPGARACGGGASAPLRRTAGAHGAGAAADRRWRRWPRRGCGRCWC